MFTTAILLCAVAAFPVSHQFWITEFEVPAVVKAGEDAELTCGYELELGEAESEIFIKWWFTAADSNGDRTQLYQQRANQPGKALKHNKFNILIKDNDTIVLDNVTPAYSGTYECEVSNIDEVRKHQELIVYTEGSGPLLNVSTVSDGPDADTEEDVLIQCEASDVAPLPDFIITVNNQEIEVDKTVTGPDANGLYGIFGNLTLTKDNVEGADVRCELIFINPNISHPPYVAVETFDPSGALTTTVAPEDPETDAPPQSLNASDYGSQIKSSWTLLFGVGVLTSLLML